MNKEQKAALLQAKLMDSNVLRFVLKGVISGVVPGLEEEQLDQYIGLIENYQSTLAYKIEDAMNFGNKLMVEFTTENIILGITADGMTKQVRKNLAEVIICLNTGSLYDAISEIKLIPADKKDAKYLTNARLTNFVNKIEDYLQIPHTTVV